MSGDSRKRARQSGIFILDTPGYGVIIEDSKEETLITANSTQITANSTYYSADRTSG